MKFKINLNNKEVELEVKRAGQQLNMILPDGTKSDVRLVHQNGNYLVLEYTDENGRSKRIRTAGHVDGALRKGRLSFSRCHVHDFHAGDIYAGRYISES